MITTKSKNRGLAVGTVDDLLKQHMSPQRIARAQKRTDAILQRMTLDELRRDRKITQTAIAKAMDIDQGAVSRIGQREAKLSTVRQYVAALGGHVEIRAVFPDKNVELSIAGE
jgi:transposase